MTGDGGENINPDALTDPNAREIYDLEGNSLSLDLTRTRQETGLTFSSKALEDYTRTLQTFVATRVMKYWKETGEPPVRMTTLVTVGIDHTMPVTHDPDRGGDLLEEALAVARSLLKVHEQVAMDTPADKAVHAEACQTFGEAIAAIERLQARG